MTSMSLEQLVHRLGGVVERKHLLTFLPRAEVDRALRDGRLVKVCRGRYALPMANHARRTAAGLHAVVSHRSAATAWGWEMKRLPDRPCLTVKRDRTLPTAARTQVELHWSRLEPHDVIDGWVTSPGRTFVDCCRQLPFDEALAIADSAQRHGTLTRSEMLRLAKQVQGPGRSQCLRVAEAATHEAENPFESVLRAIALDVAGLRVRPQALVVEQPFSVRPDLADERLRLALEADSFEWHGSREALVRDCRRYNLLTTNGWRVLRFSWEDVMLHPQYVAQTLTSMVAVVQRHAQDPKDGPVAA